MARGRHGVAVADRHCDGIVESGNRRGRSPVRRAAVAEAARLVLAPGPDGAVDLEGRGEVISGRHVAHADEALHLRRDRLRTLAQVAEPAVAVVSPTPDRAVAARAEGEVGTAG